MRKREGKTREKARTKQAKQGRRIQQPTSQAQQLKAEAEQRQQQEQQSQQLVREWLRMESNEERYVTILSVGLSALVGGAGDCASAAAALAQEMRHGISAGLLLSPAELDKLGEEYRKRQRLAALWKLIPDDRKDAFLSWCDQWISGELTDPDVLEKAIFEWTATSGAKADPVPHTERAEEDAEGATDSNS